MSDHDDTPPNPGTPWRADFAGTEEELLEAMRSATPLSALRG